MAKQTDPGQYDPASAQAHAFTTHAGSSDTARYPGFQSIDTTPAPTPDATSASTPTPGPDEAATLAKIKSGLQAWSQALPGNAEPIIGMIDAGAPLSSIYSTLTKLRQTTTNPKNTAFLDPIIQQAAPPTLGSVKSLPSTGPAQPTTGMQTVPLQQANPTIGTAPVSLLGGVNAAFPGGAVAARGLLPFGVRAFPSGH